jgi:hypothetical protein
MSDNPTTMEAVTSRPILFSAPMVVSLLRPVKPKTQTRRTPGLDLVNASPDAWDDVRCFGDEWSFRGANALTEHLVRCPYGKPGDTLWVRERSRRVGAVLLPNGRPRTIDVQYEADKTLRLNVVFPDRLQVPEHGKCLSMGCYREASRITLEITGVRVERLQGISEADAKAEGIRWTDEGPLHAHLDGGFNFPTAREAYERLWGDINGPGSWDANPWVWVVELKRATP